MRHLISLIVIVFIFSPPAEGQLFDDPQPDSVFKLHKVRSRQIKSDNPEYDSAWVTLFDKEGRVVEKIAKFPNDPTKRVMFGYDQKGKTNSEVYYYGSIEGEHTSFIYDDKGRLKSKSTKYDDGKRKMEMAVTYSPHIAVEKHYGTDGFLYRMQTTIYDDRGFVQKTLNRFYGREGKGNSQNEKLFRSTFDKQRRLIRVEQFIDRELAMTDSYAYDAKGLIKTMTIKSENQPPEIYRFFYTYW